MCRTDGRDYVRPTNHSTKINNNDNGAGHINSFIHYDESFIDFLYASTKPEDCDPIADYLKNINRHKTNKRRRVVNKKTTINDNYNSNKEEK